MSDYGMKTSGGFLPNYPQTEDLMQRILQQDKGDRSFGMTDAANPLAKAHQNAKRDLLKNYVSVFSSPAGRAVLEDLLNQTLRRSNAVSAGQMNMEQITAYMLQRDGQNGLMSYILSQLSEGENIGKNVSAPADAPSTAQSEE